LVNGDTASSLTTAPTVSSATAATANAGTYNGTITATGAADSNYTISYAAGGNLTINKAPLTITANNQTMSYGGTMPTLTASYSGFVNGDSSSSLTTLPTVSSATPATANAGTYNGTITATGAADGNYTISYAAGNLTIGKTNLMITANSQTITYGAAVPSDTVTYSGFVTGDGPSSLTALPVVSSAQNGVVYPGTYAGNYTVSGAAGNYSFTYISGNLVVLPFIVPSTVAVTSQTPVVAVSPPPVPQANTIIVANAVNDNSSGVNTGNSVGGNSAGSNGISGGNTNGTNTPSGNNGNSQQYRCDPNSSTFQSCQGRFK
jgi:hypothetical protein